MIPDWVKGLKDSFNKNHPNYIGNGFSRWVYRDGNHVWKIGTYGTYENETEYDAYVKWLKGDLKLPADFAIPHTELIGGYIKAEFIEGIQWDTYLIQSGMTEQQAWAYMDDFIDRYNLSDALGCNVLVDSAGTHWLIDMGAEDGD